MRNYNIKIFTTLVFSFFFLAESLQAIDFRGRIYSRVKEKGEPEVTVMIFETKKFAQTDADGYFEASVPEAGTYTFRILRATGMQEIKRSVSEQGELVTVYTDKVEAPKGGITVTGEKEKTVLSRYKVRGADPSRNTYVVDDLPILYPFHLLGLNSVIHNDLIKSIDIYTGAYPARFFNATGGVIEIELTDSVVKQEGAFSVSAFSTNAMFQTPTFNGKGYLIVAGRVSYLENTIGLTGLVPEGIRLPQYHDAQIKFVHNFDTEHQISFTHLSSQDGFAADLRPRPTNDPTREPSPLLSGARVALGRGFATQGLRYTWTPSEKFNNRVTLINFSPFTRFNGALGTIDASNMTRSGYISIRDDAIYQFADWLKVEFGGEHRELNYTLDGTSVRATDPSNRNPNPYDTANPAFESYRVTDKLRTNYSYGYSTLQFKFGNFKFEPGTRYDYLGVNRQGVWGPRGTVSYTFPEVMEGLTLFGGAGEYSHFPANTQASRSGGNPDLRFERATKYGGGFDQQVTKEWSLKVEVFKQEFRDSITNDPYISTPVAINPDPVDFVRNPILFNKRLNFSNRGEGWSHGYEVFIKKSNRPGTRDWFGWIAYTWSQTFRNANTVFGEQFFNTPVLSANERRVLYDSVRTSPETYYNFDQTHIVNIVYGWRINDSYQLGVRWQYRSSFPITPIIGDDGGRFRNPATNQVFFNPVTSPAENSTRLADYHRMDVRIDKFINYEWGYMNLFLELINFYARRNEVGQSFNNGFPYSLTNPSPSFDFSTLELPGGQIIPLINIGLETRF
ncbi:TonB-dependent receptor [Leptospira sp. GIMC2001]|uniref:TonB-dependent receptor n=1 Tax=Leptospira sp. GIMC2001 TaxID=1513297 RepID=UPI002349CB3E|nr:TonB-dependent receptor plug domain-containing protein [Leptospira sp. GIMC2001]WCL47692.1 TonB-dependent receptor plug domain-containing protein [Leptospira sp. GIMC2001]